MLENRKQTNSEKTMDWSHELRSLDFNKYSSFWMFSILVLFMAFGYTLYQIGSSVGVEPQLYLFGLAVATIGYVFSLAGFLSQQHEGEFSQFITKVCFYFWSLSVIGMAAFLILLYKNEHPIQYVLILFTVFISYRSYYLYVKHHAECRYNYCEKRGLEQLFSLLEATRKGDWTINFVTLYDTLQSLDQFIKADTLDKDNTLTQHIAALRYKAMRLCKSEQVNLLPIPSTLGVALLEIIAPYLIAGSGEEVEDPNLIKATLKEELLAFTDNAVNELNQVASTVPTFAYASFEEQLMDWKIAIAKKEDEKVVKSKHFKWSKILIPLLLLFILGVVFILIQQGADNALLYSQFIPYATLSFSVWCYFKAEFIFNNEEH